LRLSFLNIIILIAAFTTSSRAYGIEINLAPVFYYQSDDQSFCLKALGPIFEYTETFHAIRPLYFTNNSGTDVLFPLGHFSENRGRFTPIYKHDYSEDADRVNLFPFFYGRYQEQKYGGVFPLYGKTYHRFGFDKAHFVLWPLYSETERDDIKAYSVLWPIFKYSPDKQFRIFPFYGSRTTSDEHYTYVLWPIYHRKRGTQNMDAFLPFYLSAWGPSNRSTSVLWPLFTANHDYNSPHHSLDCPWPIVRFASGAYEETRIFPFYWSKYEGTQQRMKTILWPVFRTDYNLDTETDTLKTKNKFLILSGTTHVVSRDGTSNDTFDIWPLWHSSNQNGYRSWNIPNIIPFQHKGFQRNWAPLLTLMHGKQTDSSYSWNILWNTVYYTKNEDKLRLCLSFLTSYETGHGYTRIGLLCDLVKLTWQK